jgi:hypothetical protein
VSTLFSRERAAHEAPLSDADLGRSDVVVDVHQQVSVIPDVSRNLEAKYSMADPERAMPVIAAEASVDHERAMHGVGGS